MKLDGSKERATDRLLTVPLCATGTFNGHHFGRVRNPENLIIISIKMIAWTLFMAISSYLKLIALIELIRYDKVKQYRRVAHLYHPL